MTDKNVRVVTGKALASVLGEAVFVRAIADLEWVRARFAETESGHSRRALVWGQEAFARADLHIRWSVTKDERTALALEAQVRDLLLDPHFPDAAHWVVQG